MKTLIRIFITALALISMFRGLASAYVLDEDGNGHPLHWESMPVEHLLVRSNVPGGIAGEDAVERAFRTWNDASTNVDFRFAGYASSGVQRYDGKNIVFWVYQGWAFDSTLAAATFRFYDTNNGRLLDADIVFNGESYAWAVGGSSFDIENSATHEIGHLCGLGHSTDREATMYGKTYASETKKRSLESDDVAGLDALYGGTRRDSTGNVVNSGSTGGSTGGVSGGGGGGGCSLGSSPNAGGSSDLLWLAALLVGISLRHHRKWDRSKFSAL